MFKRLLTFTVLAAITSLLAAATAVPIDAGKSKLTAAFTQMGVSVDGTFKTFKGTVAYDPANAAASTAELSIDTASFDIGDDDYNAEVRKKEWFDTATYPAATFRSTAIKPLGAENFEATGTLNLKGKTQTVKVPVSVKTAGKVRSFEGELPISRTAFGMGDPEWNEVLEDKVIVKFVIVAPAG
jgi:polyisoprenoid-binding protein YceI